MIEKISTLFKAHQLAFQAKSNFSYEQRKKNLLALRSMILENEPKILRALEKDLGKSELEGVVSETLFLVKEIDHTLKKLKKWMKRKRVSTPWLQLPARSFIQPEPIGVVLIISPWNYPFQLLISPLVGALAAGNVAILKPSEIASETSRAVSELIPKYFEESIVSVVEGAVEETTSLLGLPFNHIFYTGNGHVGRIVMEKASRHLTPVTLELGGKSPCLIWGDNDLSLVAKRLVWGKFFNAGQTCVAPDYVLIENSKKKALVSLLENTLKEFYPDGPRNSPDYGKIVSVRHFDRLLSYIPEEEVLVGAHSSKDELFLSPTILDAKSTSPSMKEEIFGPILPILTIESLEEGISFIKSRPNPLAAYIFSKDESVLERYVLEVQSGGMCLNDSLVHLTNGNLPFGGIGESGMGSYHGKKSFDIFTHYKSVMKRGTFLDLALRYPPYFGSLSIIRKLLNWFG